jgi:hypothetical protein
MRWAAAWVFRRFGVAGVVLAVLATGCSAVGVESWRVLPWEKNPYLAEDFRSPPEQDARYDQPHFPRSAMRSGLKRERLIEREREINPAAFRNGAAGPGPMPTASFTRP